MLKRVQYDSKNRLSFILLVNQDYRFQDDVDLLYDIGNHTNKHTIYPLLNTLYTNGLS